jgi:hypothetical protein
MVERNRYTTPFDSPPLQLHAHTLPYKPLLIGGPGIACLQSEPLEEVCEQFLSQAIDSLDMILTSATAYIKNDAIQLSALDTFQPCHHTLSIFLHYGWVMNNEFHWML